MTDRYYEIIRELGAIDAQTDRAVREAILTGDKTRLQSLEDKATLLRAELAGIQS